MKKILIVVGVLAVLAVVGVALLLMNLGSVIKSAVEKYGSQATQAEVTLASADVSLSTGAGELKGFVVGNPAGFKEPAAIEMGRTLVQVDTASLTADTIVVKEVVVEGPKITYEMDTRLRSNLLVLQENVRAWGSRIADGGGAAPTKPEGGGKKIRIEHFRVKGGVVRLASPVPGGEHTQDLPEIDVTDIGAGGGATTEQVTARILDVLIEEAIKAAVKGGLEQKAKGALGGAVDKATDALGGLLGGDSKDDKGTKQGDGGKKRPKQR